MIDKIRQELYECIEKYGLNDERTIRKSEELDVFVVREQYRQAA